MSVGVVTPCSFVCNNVQEDTDDPEDGGSMFLQNVGIHPQDCTSRNTDDESKK
jgi:hypothetical protein